jgi:surface protein
VDTDNTGFGDTPGFSLDTTDGNGTDSNTSGEQLVTITGTVYYDGIVPGAAYVWALEANGSNAAEHILPAGEGNFSLSVAKGGAYDFKAFIDGTGNGHPNNGEVWKHFEDWNNTVGAYNLTQVDGNLTGIDFYLSDKDADFDGFLDWEEYQAGSGINDANSTPGLDFGLVAWYTFDGNASDMSGNGNHGTVHGATLGIDRHGEAAKAFNFDGLGNYIRISNPIDSFQKEFTISVWLITNAGGGSVFSKYSYQSGQGNGFTLGITDEVGSGAGFNGSTIHSTTIANDSWQFSAHPSYTLTPNVFTHVVAVYDQGTASLYIDDLLQSSKSYSYQGNILDNSYDILLGTYFKNSGSEIASDETSHGFDGVLDDLRLFNRALSPDEVHALYELEKPIPLQPLTDANFQDAINLWFDTEANATALYGHIRDWNTSAVTSMSQAFKGRTNFNEDISGWDVSSVNIFGQMFMEASSFNQDIGDWNVSQGTNLGQMFMDATAFNQDIGDWDVSSAINMGNMFTRASALDQDISDWDVSSVTNMTWIFLSNSSLSSANKGKIHAAFSANPNWTMAWSNFVVSEQLTDANFQTAVNLWFDNQAEANATYGHIRDWNVSLVTDMSNAFMNRSTFNEDISDWDTRNVSVMTAIFRDASAFNQDIGNWNMQSVTDLRMAFYGATAFNQDIGNWDLSSALYLRAMFNQATSFNHDLDGWALSQDANMTGGMFFNADNLSEINMGKIHTTLSPNPTWPHDWSAFTADPNTSLPGDQNTTMDGNYSGPGDGYEGPNDGLGDMDGNQSDLGGEHDGPDGNNTAPGDGYEGPNDGLGNMDGNQSELDGENEGLDVNNSGPGDGYEGPNDGLGNMDGNQSDLGGEHDGPDGNYSGPGDGHEGPGDGLGNMDGNQSDLGGEHDGHDGNYSGPGDGYGDPNDGLGDMDGNQSEPGGEHDGHDGNYSGPGDGYEGPNDGLGDMDGNQSELGGEHDGHDGNYSGPGDEYEEPVEEMEPLFVPIVRTEPVEEMGDGVYLFRGRVLTDGGDSILEVGFEISKSLRFFEPIRLPTQLEQGEFYLLFDDLEPGTSYYARAYARNSIGESPGSRKRFVTRSIPQPNFWWGEGEELPGGWLNSSWFGTFKSYGYDWIYHGSMGWLYTSPVEEEGVWLWKDGMGWLWTREGVWPYLWSHQHGDWIYLPPGRAEPIFYDYSIQGYENF